MHYKRHPQLKKPKAKILRRKRGGGGGAKLDNGLWSFIVPGQQSIFGAKLLSHLVHARMAASASLLPKAA